MTETFYDVLEVSEDASEAEIRRAFRRQVKKWHPDVSDRDGAADRFQKIQRAQEVLTDAHERDRYDDLGHEAYAEWFDEDGGPSSGSSSTGSATADRRRTDDGAGDDPATPGGDSRETSTASGAAGSATSTRSSGSTSTSGGAAGSSGSSGSSAASSSGSSGSSAASSSGSSGSSAASSSGSETGGSSGGSTSGSSESPRSSSAGGSSGTSSKSSVGPASSPGGAGESDRRSSAVSEEAVAAEAGRWRKTWQAAARETDGGSGTHAVGRSPGGDLEAARIATGIARKIRSRDAGVLTLVLLAIYPGLIAVGVSHSELVSAAPLSDFSLWAYAVVWLVALLVVVYALTEPVVSLVVFGTWSLLMPLFVLFLDLSFLELGVILAIAACWVPFVLSVLLALATPD